MDPALEISSPFRNEAKASEGNYDQAIDHITNGDAPATYWGLGGSEEAEGDMAGSSSIAEVSAAERRTACSMCGEQSTAAAVPKDGLYRCPACVAGQEREGRPRVFPVGTFKCCPTAREEGEGGVACCAGCGGWYHMRCVGLAPDEGNGPLRQYVALSTTKWYCIDPACCEKALIKQLKKSKKL